jgi:hypothetical protein
MAGIIEQFWENAKQEGVDESKHECAYRMLLNGKLTLEEIAECVDLPLEVVEWIQREKMTEN